MCENPLKSTKNHLEIHEIYWILVGYLQYWPKMLEQSNFAKEKWNMTFNFPHSPISMLQSVITKLLDVLPASFYNIDWGRGGK